jgi:hypothetical protein
MTNFISQTMYQVPTYGKQSRGHDYMVISSTYILQSFPIETKSVPPDKYLIHCLWYKVCHLPNDRYLKLWNCQQNNILCSLGFEGRVFRDILLLYCNPVQQIIALESYLVTRISCGSAQWWGHHSYSTECISENKKNA